MTDALNPAASSALSNLIESAHRLGIEMDEAEALQWLSAMAAGFDQEITMDIHSGVFGHRVVMLDFSPQQLAHFREIGRLVEFKDQPGVVETALALSGSAAQSKIQSFPGDCDYFERVNMLALPEASGRLLGVDGRVYIWNVFTSDGKIRLTNPLRRLENVVPGRYTFEVEGGVRREVAVTEGGRSVVSVP